MQQLTEPSEAAEIRSCGASSPGQGNKAGCLKLSSVKRWRRVWTGHGSCWNGKQCEERPKDFLELPSLWESTGCLSGEASAPFHQSSCCQVGVSEVESFLLFFMRHHQRIRVTEFFFFFGSNYVKHFLFGLFEN